MADERPAAGGEDPRVRFAGERTLLAWVRTGLALMGFGFVVARFGLFLRQLAPLQPDVVPPATGPSLWIGVAMVALGIIINVLAAREHLRFLYGLERGDPYRPPRWSLGIAVAGGLAVCGIIMAAYLIALRV